VPEQDWWGDPWIDGAVEYLNRNFRRVQLPARNNHINTYPVNTNLPETHTRHVEQANLNAPSDVFTQLQSSPTHV
jgi:hypothetical protein